MIWLELRKDIKTYDLGWNLTESVWAPTRKSDGKHWPFWDLIKQVERDDIVFHLHQEKDDTKFIGYSTATTDGYVTHSLPTKAIHQWDYVNTFYKVDLHNFQSIEPHIYLSNFFRTNNQVLLDYFIQNKAQGAKKKRLFYVIQRNRLQCLNGAYFSEFNNIFPNLLLINIKNSQNINNVAESVHTDEVIKDITQRVGHQEFSENVKNNYNHKCCFPNCKVESNGFLVSGHIDRWVDNKSLRGHTGNGLCLCLMHDKAFENGFFTLDKNFKIKVMTQYIANSKWLIDFLQKGENKEIKSRQIDPLIEALKKHWKRIGYKI